MRDKLRMTIKQLLGTALLGLGLNYCASTQLDYQNHPLAQHDQQRFSELKDKVDYLKSVSKKEYANAEQDILDARNADEFYEANTRHTLFGILQIDEKNPHLHQRMQLKLTGLSLNLANRPEVERWTRGPHVPGRKMYSSGNFTSTCPGLKNIEALLQNQYGIDLRRYDYPFPVSRASEHLGELWREGNYCRQ